MSDMTIDPNAHTRIASLMADAAGMVAGVSLFILIDILAE